MIGIRIRPDQFVTPADGARFMLDRLQVLAERRHRPVRLAFSPHVELGVGYVLALGPAEPPTVLVNEALRGPLTDAVAALPPDHPVRYEIEPERPTDAAASHP